MQLTKNLVIHACTNNIEVHYHFVCDRVLSSEVKLRYVRTDPHVTNIFTKALRVEKLDQFSKMLGIQHLDVPHLGGSNCNREY